MDIVIFSAAFGGGHRGAAAAIESYLTSRYAEECTVSTIDFFERFTPNLNTLAKFAYEQSVQFFPATYGRFFELTDRFPDSPVVRELSRVGLADATEFLADARPDAVISVFPVSGAVASEAKERAVAGGEPEVALPYCATVVTDYGAHSSWIHPSTDDYFVASEETKESLAAQGVAWARVHATGIPISPSFLDLPAKAEARSRHGLADLFTVLLMSGGVGLTDTHELCEAMAGLGVQVVAVAGRNEKLLASLTDVAGRYRRVRAIGWTEHGPELMRASDVLLGKAGGITVAEACAVGLPLVFAGGVPGQEVFNVDFLVNYGAALSARDSQDAQAKIDFLAHHPARMKEMAAHAKRLGKPDATRLACERVVAAIRERDQRRVAATS